MLLRTADCGCTTIDSSLLLLCCCCCWLAGCCCCWLDAWLHGCGHRRAALRLPLATGLAAQLLTRTRRRHHPSAYPVVASSPASSLQCEGWCKAFGPGRQPLPTWIIAVPARQTYTTAALRLDGRSNSSCHQGWGRAVGKDAPITTINVGCVCAHIRGLPLRRKDATRGAKNSSAAMEKISGELSVQVLQVLILDI
eukprot:COSAG01_NODE_1556_length_9940_cov_13.610337_3_plen_196_part_00